MAARSLDPGVAQEARRAESGSRFAHIDALRAFAVLLVVVGHAGLGNIVPGGSGVTIFFAISGFIITFLMLRERDRTGAFSIFHFYARRFLKLGPPLVVAVLIPTAVYAIAHQISLPAVLSQVFFYYNWWPKTGSAAAVLPGSEVVWSLAIEEQFYVIFAIVWLGVVKRKNYVEVVMGVAAFVIVSSLATKFVLARNPANVNRIYFDSDTRADGIAYGVLTAGLYYTWLHGGHRWNGVRRFVTSDWALPSAIVLFLLTLALREPYFRDTVRYPLQGVCACIVILFGLLAPQRRQGRLLHSVSSFSVVKVIGLASYSIYLTHFSLYALILPHIQSVPHPIRVAILIVAGVGVGIMIYRIVEVPFEAVRGKLHSGVPGPEHHATVEVP